MLLRITISTCHSALVHFTVFPPFNVLSAHVTRFHFATLEIRSPVSGARPVPGARRRFPTLISAWPALILLSASLFSHKHGVITTDRSTAGRLSYLPFCFYPLQFPFGVFIALRVAHWADEFKYLAIVTSLVAVQMLFAFSVALFTSLEITGDSF